MRTLLRQPLLRCLMATSFLLILLLYLIDYQIAEIYTRTFPDADELTAILGRLTTVLSVLGFVVSAWLVPRAMTRLGVRHVAMVVPVLGGICSGALALVYQLPSAILATTTRQAVVGAFDDPVQNLLLGIPGPRLQAKARARSEAGSCPSPWPLRAYCSSRSAGTGSGYRWGWSPSRWLVFIWWRAGSCIGSTSGRC